MENTKILIFLAADFFLLILTAAVYGWKFFKKKNTLLGLECWVVAISTIYDFFHIPDDDEQHTIFYIAALSTWALIVVVLYYAYCA